MARETETAADGRSLLGPRRLNAIEAIRGEIGPLLAGSVMPFVLILYLGLEGGGYDAIVRSEVGIAIWWIVLLGALVGLFPAGRISRAGWAAVALLGAFAAWTAIGISWSESSERSVAELARVGTFLGVFVLALVTQGREALRRTASAIGAALALVGILALLSRLEPSWFPANETSEVLTGAGARLNYPVNYWNGLAAMMAIAIPLMMCVAIESRRLVTQALATAVLPVLALTAFYTLSRGGALEVAAALLGFFALYPRRLAALPTLALGALGAVLLIAAATQRDALEAGQSSGAALAQGDEMLALVLVVCAGVALVRVAIGLAGRHGLGPRPRVTRGRAAAAAAVLVTIGLVAAVAAGAPGELSERWEEFKQPGGAGSDVSRFESASGTGRYQQWQSAIDAFESEPLTGIGAGVYEYWWARSGTLSLFVRDAHSLYLESLAELGLVGFALIVALVAGTVAIGAWRSLKTTIHERPWMAAATAAAAAFAVAAAIDWVWELTVVAVAFFLLAAAILGHREEAGHAPSRSRTAPRLALGALAVAGLAAIAIPLAATSSVRASQSAADSAQLSLALERAQQAAEFQPYAATPSLQQALVHELGGNLEAAAASAREATREEPTNWRTWLVLSRIEAYRGNAEASLSAYRESRSLNPSSPLFAR